MFDFDNDNDNDNDNDKKYILVNFPPKPFLSWVHRRLVGVHLLATWTQRDRYWWRIHLCLTALQGFSKW